MSRIIFLLVLIVILSYLSTASTLSLQFQRYTLSEESDDQFFFDTLVNLFKPKQKSATGGSSQEQFDEAEEEMTSENLDGSDSDDDERRFERPEWSSLFRYERNRPREADEDVEDMYLLDSLILKLIELKDIEPAAKRGPRLGSFSNMDADDDEWDF